MPASGLPLSLAHHGDTISMGRGWVKEGLLKVSKKKGGKEDGS